MTNCNTCRRCLAPLPEEKKMTTPTDALATLGTIINDTVGRDAIHIATYPVTAAEQLHPGQHIGLGPDGATTRAEHIGIVDAFLTGPVFPGQRFWMMLYPRTITSLRHAWAHPAIDDEPVAAEPLEPIRRVSEAWMRRWAMKHMADDYYGVGGQRSEDDAYRSAIEAGENNHVGPYEDARDHIDGEWWTHWEVITGKRGNRDEYFSCGC